LAHAHTYSTPSPASSAGDAWHQTTKTGNCDNIAITKPRVNNTENNTNNANRNNKANKDSNVDKDNNSDKKDIEDEDDT
jgi:hypothetical protein